MLPFAAQIRIANSFDLDHTAASAQLSRALIMYALNMDLENTGRFLQEALNNQEKEDVVLMLLKVAAADGEQRADEIQAIDDVVEALSVSPQAKHQAYQRYFAEQ